MSQRKRLAKLEAQKAARRRAESIGVRMRWTNAAGEVLELGDPIADASVSINLDGSGERAPAPTWLDGTLTVPIGEQPPPKRKGPPPSPEPAEPGSTRWYVERGMYVGSPALVPMELLRALDPWRPERAPGRTVGLAWVPKQWQRSQRAGMR